MGAQSNSNTLAKRSGSKPTHTKDRSDTRTPYSQQPPEAFWRSAISDMSALQLRNIYKPRFVIERNMKISAAGSCFAQHIGAQFKRRDYHFVDLEPPPDGLPQSKFHSFGFDLYSARYGNVYSVRQLLQMFLRARGEYSPNEHAWTRTAPRETLFDQQ